MRVPIRIQDIIRDIATLEFKCKLLYDELYAWIDDNYEKPEDIIQSDELSALQNGIGVQEAIKYLKTSK